MHLNNCYKKVQVGKDQEKAQKLHNYADIA